MSDLSEETIYFERDTVREVVEACGKVLGDRVIEVQPSMFDASVVMRHPPGRGPTQQEVDRIAEILREGRPLLENKADWHASTVVPYCDAIDMQKLYGSTFALVRAFLPSRSALDRLRA